MEHTETELRRAYALILEADTIIRKVAFDTEHDLLVALGIARETLRERLGISIQS